MNGKESNYTQLPTADKPQTKKGKRKKKKASSEINKELNTTADSLHNANDVSGGNALKSVIGLIANVASYNSTEKVDYDADGNQIVDGVSRTKKQYRSSQNISEYEDVSKAISQQEQELKDAREEAVSMQIEWISQEDIDRVIEDTRDALQARLFGPLWDNWTNADDFLAVIKTTLEQIIDTFDPLLDAVDQIEEYISGSKIEKVDIKVFKTRSGDTVKLPLGVMAIQALSIILDYIRQLIRNIEKLATEYTVEELNALLRKGTGGSNWGTVLKSIQDLIQLIVDCMKPYIHNIVMALILDAIDMIVDKLDKLGLLSPSGPLKLIPVAITLVRAILRGDLEAIEEMVKQTISKLINLVQLMLIAKNDPSILWADTERLDKEIAVARYKELAEDEDGFTEADKDKFFNYTDTTYTAAARHYLQKMKNETNDSFGRVKDLASAFTDLSMLYKKSVAENNVKNENADAIDAKIQEGTQKAIKVESSIQKNLVEPKYP